jgi:hypothetical protein
MGLSCSQHLGLCQTHILEFVHVYRIKLLIYCWQSVSIGYIAHLCPRFETYVLSSFYFVAQQPPVGQGLLIDIHAMRYDMIWYVMMWCDMIWYGMVWCDVMWYDMIWCDVIWYGMIWCDVIWYDTWYDVIWYDMIHDIIWYDMMIWHMIWYDMVYLTATGLTPSGSSTVHIYTQTMHRIQRMEHT